MYYMTQSVNKQKQKPPGGFCFMCGVVEEVWNLFIQTPLTNKYDWKSIIKTTSDKPYFY